jgi:hypothetical protein
MANFLLCNVCFAVNFFRADSRVNLFEFCDITVYQNPKDGDGVVLRNVGSYEKYDAPFIPEGPS